MLDLLADADRLLVRTVDSLSDDELASPSLLPGWTRAHVVAHLALNGEGLARALTGVVTDEPAPMYDSQEARDADIEQLSQASPTELRERLMGAVTLYTESATALPESRQATRIERTPGGPTFPAGDTVVMRLREVEVHHADLGAGYSPADWSHGFCAVLLESMRQRRWPTSFQVHATDMQGTWEYGEGPGGPLVTGAAGDLGWWLTGRGDGSRLKVEGGELPEAPAW
ncbi:maleylpyruvate isomerase family mycothiol-dependent enzyme [Nocardioides gansuensis]|nr:maleylpyruvate isomerase family mycothiol-dependent enzyme [Nocardioides gansuensis]